MAEQLMKYNPPIIRGELAPLELIGFRGLDKGVLLSLAFHRHAVGDDDVLEAFFLTNIVALQSTFGSI